MKKVFVLGLMALSFASFAMKIPKVRAQAGVDAKIY